MKHATLCFLIDGHDPSKVLLGMKKRGFGEGKFNGIGGKLSPGESPEMGVLREVHEEIGVHISPSGLHAAGRLIFHFPYRPAYDHLVHLFVATAWKGSPQESDEMAPQWVRVDRIPFDRMWQDDAYWLPIVLRGHGVNGEFTFGEDNESVVAWSLLGTEPTRWDR